MLNLIGARLRPFTRSLYMVKRFLIIALCLFLVDGAINQQRAEQLKQAREYYNLTRDITATIKRFPQFKKADIVTGAQ